MDFEFSEIIESTRVFFAGQPAHLPGHPIQGLNNGKVITATIRKSKALGDDHIRHVFNDVPIHRPETN